jgi:L-iditol 2-dehydrogenase
MRQAILKKPGELEIRDVPVPEPSEGEVVIRIRAALTCGTDLKAYIRGHSLIPMPGPFGHEYSGTIARVGKGVDRFREGDEVMGVHSAPCLSCRLCKKGKYNLCEHIMDTKALGAFAEYLLLPSNVVRTNLFHKPSELEFEIAAILEPLSCVVHPYRRFIHEKIETALIMGSGPIGLLHLFCLREMGAEVIVSDISDERLNIANDMGAHRTSLPEQLERVIAEETDGAGVDLVVECTGKREVWEESIKYVCKGGAVILFGGCPPGTEACFDTYRLHYDEISIMGSFHYTPDDVAYARDLLIKRKTELFRLISGRVPLDKLEDSLRLLMKGKGIKYAVNP